MMGRGFGIHHPFDLMPAFVLSGRGEVEQGRDHGVGSVFLFWDWWFGVVVVMAQAAVVGLSWDHVGRPVGFASS
jgi:hypothetical protein